MISENNLLESTYTLEFHFRTHAYIIFILANLTNCFRGVYCYICGYSVQYIFSAIPIAVGDTYTHHSIRLLRDIRPSGFPTINGGNYYNNNNNNNIAFRDPKGRFWRV